MTAPTPPEVRSGTAPKKARQKRTLVAIGLFLIGAGLALLFALERVPMPLRILMGLTDVIAGAVLLLVVRQKFSS